MAPRQLALLVVLAAPVGGLNMLDGVKKLLLKRDSAFLYQEKALFMPGANARTEAAAKTADRGFRGSGGRTRTTGGTRTRSSASR